MRKYCASAVLNPPMKVSPTTGKDTYAFSKTDEEFKALLEHENVNVQAVVAARLGMRSTIEETRTERFIEIGQRVCYLYPCATMRHTLGGGAVMTK